MHCRATQRQKLSMVVSRSRVSRWKLSPLILLRIFFFPLLFFFSLFSISLGPGVETIPVLCFSLSSFLLRPLCSSSPNQLSSLSLFLSLYALISKRPAYARYSFLAFPSTGFLFCRTCVSRVPSNLRYYNNRSKENKWIFSRTSVCNFFVQSFSSSRWFHQDRWRSADEAAATLAKLEKPRGVRIITGLNREIRKLPFELFRDYYKFHDQRASTSRKVSKQRTL